MAILDDPVAREILGSVLTRTLASVLLVVATKGQQTPKMANWRMIYVLTLILFAVHAEVAFIFLDQRLGLRLIPYTLLLTAVVLLHDRIREDPPFAPEECRLWVEFIVCRLDDIFFTFEDTANDLRKLIVRLCTGSRTESLDAALVDPTLDDDTLDDDTPDDDTPEEPDDAALAKALKALRVHSPSLGRAKIIERFRKEKGWQITNRRMKACMDAFSLGTISAREIEEAKKRVKLPCLPAEALVEQLKFGKRTKGGIILHGCGEFDYSIVPVADMCPVIEKAEIYIAEFLKIFRNKRMEIHRQEYLAYQTNFRVMWKMYKHAAERIDKMNGHEMSLEMVRRQFKAEYRVDPFLAAERNPRRNAYLENHDAMEYKKFKKGILKILHKTQPDLVELDDKGKPIWNEAVHGQFSTTISAMHKPGWEAKHPK